MIKIVILLGSDSWTMAFSRAIKTAIQADQSTTVCLEGNNTIYLNRINNSPLGERILVYTRPIQYSGTADRLVEMDNPHDSVLVVHMPNRDSSDSYSDEVLLPGTHIRLQ